MRPGQHCVVDEHATPTGRHARHARPAQKYPAQHGADLHPSVLHAVGRHAPSVHVSPAQQPDVAVHDAPLAAHDDARHRPPEQLPEQQSRPRPQVAPTPAHDDARHTPLEQVVPAQQFVDDAHDDPLAPHDGARQNPPAQLIEQHCASAVHVSPVLGQVS